MYRVFPRLAWTGTVLALMSAMLGGITTSYAEKVALQAPPAQADSGLSARFGDVLDARIRQEAAQAKDDQDEAWLAQLKSFYGSRQGRPVWVSAKGWNAQARTAIDELGKAADWGLEPAAFPTPALVQSPPSDDDLAGAELGLSRTVVKYASHARGGRIPDPSALSLWLGRTEDPVYATAVMIEMISNADAGAALRSMHPPYADFELLRQAYVAMRKEIENPRQLDPADVVPAGKQLKVGEWDPAVLVIRRRVGLSAAAGFESQFDEKLANAIGKYMDQRDIDVRWGRIDDKIRAVFNRPPPPPKKEDLQRLLANMERWRWLPRDLGKFHIWNNLPEFVTRIVKDDQIIHQERIIVGQPHTQTPIFTNMMRQVVFQPEWGVPPSIKINDLLPKLQGGDYGVLERRNMRILGASGRELSPGRFNWEKVDIRDIGIFQRSGDSNPLGRVKFLFPNKHHVYMHDTNNRSLFKAEERLFSHGCVRVRDPEKLAKLLLREDRGWDETKVEALLEDWDTPNNKIELDHPFPVHNVYFTFVPGPNNTLVKLDDMYEHDKRVIRALSGVPFAKIAEGDPARDQQAELEEAAPPAVRRAMRDRGDDDE
jgi:L,D-transpeptidase YcbB